jgi:hypothetical protein
MSLREDRFFAGARLRAAAGAAALGALIAFLARGRFVTSATGASVAALAGFARFAAEIVFPFLRVAIYQCTVTLSPLRPSSR